MAFRLKILLTSALQQYRTKTIEQYGRRENLRIYNVPESNNNTDDGEEMTLKIAKK